MKIRLLALFLFGLLNANQARATTAARQNIALARTNTHQVIPRDMLRAGQDIELRKVQAMLSGQRPQKVTNADQRR